MNRFEKHDVVQATSQRLKNSVFTVLVDYCGMTVAQFTELRRQLRATCAEVRVVKNTLAKLAVKDLDAAALAGYFVEATAVITTLSDPVASAKVLVKFTKDVEKLKVRIGFLSGKIIQAREIEVLSKLPSREEMIGCFLGSMQAPARNLVGVLSNVPRNLVNALVAIKHKKQ